MTDSEYWDRRQQIEDYECRLDDEERADMRRQLDEQYYQEDEYGR